MQVTRGVKTAADVEDFELMDFEKAQAIRTRMSSTILVSLNITPSHRRHAILTPHNSLLPLAPHSHNSPSLSRLTSPITLTPTP